MSDPALAIVVTTHNESSLVSTCLRSVRSQTRSDWECVVMDDHSTDDTAAIAAREVAGDPRFRVVTSDRTVGLARQRNAGVAATSAPFIAFLDGDDFYYPDAVASRLDAAETDEHPALGGVFCNWVEVEDAAVPGPPPNARRRPRVTWFKGTSVEGVPFIATAPMLRRDAFLAVGGFRAVAISEDVDLWQRMLRAGFYFDAVKNVGVAYRQRNASMLRRSSIESARFIAGLIAAAAEPLPSDEGVGPFVFGEPFFAYLPRMMLVRRLVRSVAFGIATGGADDAAEMAAIEAGFESHMEWTLDLDRLIGSVARLAGMATADPEAGRKRVAAGLRRRLSGLAEAARQDAARWRGRVAPLLDVGDAIRSEAS